METPIVVRSLSQVEDVIHTTLTLKQQRYEKLTKKLVFSLKMSEFWENFRIS
jgi:hypothetical protein